MANPFDDPNPFDEEDKSSSKLSEEHGVKRLELHKVAKEPPVVLEQPEEKSFWEKAAEYLSPHTATGAAAHGVSKGATLGFGDEAYGILAADADRNEALRRATEDVADAKSRGTYDPSAAAPAIPGVTSYQLKREGHPTLTVARAAKTAPVETETSPLEPDWTQAYRQARDSMREQYGIAEKEHPGSFLAGELAGGMAVPLPGPGKAKGLAKVGKYALQGGLTGVAAGLGNSDKEGVGGNLLDAAKGGAGGFLVGGALGYGASKLDPWLEKQAARRAFKALDPYMESIRKSLGPDATKGEILAEAERLGRRALDEGVIPEGALGRWANSEQLAENAAQKAEEAGQLKGGFVDYAQDALEKQGSKTPVSLGQLATRIEQEAEQAKISGNQKLARKLLKEAADIRQTVVDRASAGFADPAAQTLQEAEKFKTGLQGQVDYGAKLPSREAQTAVARLAKEQAEKAIESGLGPDELEAFKALKAKYGDLASISDIANHGAVRSFRNNAVGLGDKLAAQVGAHAAAGPMAIPAALASAGAHHFANHRGAAGLARTLSNAAQRTSPLLVPSAEIGPEAEDKWKTLRGEK